MLDNQKFKTASAVILGAVFSVIMIEFPRAFAFLPGTLAFIALTTTYYIHRKVPLTNIRLVSSLFLVVCISFISVLWSIEPDISLDRSLKVLPIFIAGIMAIILAGNANILNTSKYMLFLSAMVFIGALVAITELQFGDQIYRIVRDLPDHKHVPDAVYNRGSVILILSLFTVIGYYSLYLKKHHVTGLIMLTTLFLLFITDSQSTQLAFLLGSAFFLLFPYQTKIAWGVLVIGIIILTLTAPIITPFAYNHAEAINSLPFFGGNMGYAGPRLEIWDYVARYVNNSVVYGHGIEATRAINDFDSSEVFIDGNTILHPHNFALQVWIEFGALGAIICCAFLANIILYIYKIKNIKCQRIGLATFIAALSISATGYGLWQSWWLGTLFFSAANVVYLSRLNMDITES